MEFFMPVRLYTGRRCTAAHAAEIAALGRRCLIVTGHSGGRLSGALDDALTLLDSLDIKVAVFDGIRSNPTVESCIEAARAFPEADFVWGIGGGSALDAAKAVSVFCANCALDEERFYAKDWTRAPLPIVLSGTTAGTGSEVTSVSVLTDKRGRKHSIHDDRLYARLAFGDYGYTQSQPQSVTLSTGLDAVMHCVESFLSKKADEASMACAARGISLVCAHLRPEPDEKDREALYEASILGGLAINTTGTCFPHNVGYFLTENRGIPHGIACAVFLPELLSHCAEAAPERLALMEKMSGCTKEEMLALLEASVGEHDIRFSEKEVRAALPRWENNGSVANTPGALTTQDVYRFLSKFIG